LRDSISLIYDSGGLTDGCAVAVCNGDGVALLELASGSGDSLVGVRRERNDGGGDCPGVEGGTLEKKIL